MSVLYNNAFKCYKVSSGAPIEIQDAFVDGLKEIIIETVYKEIQVKKDRDNLIGDEIFGDYESHDIDELNRIIKISHREEDVEIDDMKYSIKYLMIRTIDTNLFKPQLFVFITDTNSSAHFNTILLTRSIPKLSNLFFKYLINQQGFLVNQLKISSDVLKNCLNSSMHSLIKYKSGVELSFGNLKTIDNSLSSITLQVKHQDLKTFSRNDNFIDQLFDFLDKETAISFDKLDLTRLNCNIFHLSSDGRFKLFDDYNYGETTRDAELSWSILSNLFSA